MVRNSLRIYIYALLRGELLPWTVHTLERQYLPLTKVQLTATPRVINHTEGPCSMSLK